MRAMSAKPPIKMQLYLVKTSFELCCNHTPAPCEAVFPTRGLASTALPAHTLPPLFKLFFYSLKMSSQFYTTLLSIGLCFCLDSASITLLGELYPSGPFLWSSPAESLTGFGLAWVLISHVLLPHHLALVKLPNLSQS